MLEVLFDATLAVLAFKPALALLLGTAAGIVVGAVPGLSATMAIALLIPFTYSMDVLTALALLAGVHNGAAYGGAIPAILLRIPGTSGAIATTFDGYPMAQQGRVGDALYMSAFSSAVGGMLSALALILLAPPLAKVTLVFGPTELLWVNVFGLASISLLVGEDKIKGIMAAAFGLLLGTVGIDTVTGHERFTFGMTPLTSGLSLVVVMVGMYSLPPAWAMGEAAIREGMSKEALRFGVAGKVKDKLRIWSVMLRSSFIGIIIGILPGGGSVGGFIAYNEAKRTSRDPDSFGKGNPEGVAAVESANNADNAAAMIPTLTLGVPGSGIAALMMGALMIQGFQPGPQLFVNAPTVVYGYTIQMFLSSLVLLWVGGQLATRFFGQMLRLPQLLLMPMIICVTLAAAYSSENSYFNVYAMLAFGLIGLAFERLQMPIAPVIIGLVLGAKAEFHLRISLLLSDGDWSVFYASRISQVMIVLTLLLVFSPLIQGALARRRVRPPTAPGWEGS